MLNGYQEQRTEWSIDKGMGDNLLAVTGFRFIYIQTLRLPPALGKDREDAVAVVPPPPQLSGWGSPPQLSSWRGVEV